ncbi:MAG: hypothetical protein GY816_07120, partial [Cytophagales bacterium]|nr:hypothetical protein [Cytophagales bacterium]
HGSPDIFELNPTKTLNAEDLDKDLDENISGRLIFIYDACNSGTFVPQMIPPEGKERIVITSTDKDEDAHFGHKGGLSFSYQFWLAVIRGADLNEAFFLAKNIMEKKQKALAEVDGDGDSDADDWNLLSEITIGSGFGIAGDLPHIEEVCIEKECYDQKIYIDNSTTLQNRSIENSDEYILHGETSATIRAKGVEDTNGIRKVLAIITPPCFDPGPRGKPVTDLPAIELTDSNEDGIYEGVYEHFTRKGVYEIEIYAIDTKGFYSLPQKIAVEQAIPSESIPGDVDNCDCIDLKDAILALKVLAGFNEDNINADADINSDGKIGMEEVVYTLQKVSGWL